MARLGQVALMAVVTVATVRIVHAQTPSDMPAAAAPASPEDAKACRRAAANAMEALFFGLPDPGSYFEPPTGDARKEFDAVVKMTEATTRLQSAMDKRNPASEKNAARDGLQQVMASMRADIEKGTVEVAGDTATLTATVDAPEKASGKHTMVRKLVRRDGVWKLDAVSAFGLTGSAKTVEILAARTAVIEEVIADVEAGKEKPPLRGEILIQKKMFTREMEKRMREATKDGKPKAPSDAERPTSPKVDAAPAEGETARIVVPGRVRCLGFVDGETVIAGATHTEDSLATWNLRTGKRLNVFKVPGEEFHVHAVRVSKTGALAVDAGEWYSTDELREAKASQPSKSAYEQAGTAGCGVRVWDLTTGKLLRRMDGDDVAVIAMDLSHDDRLIAFGTVSGTVIVCETATGEVVKTIPGAKAMWQVGGLKFSPDDGVMAVSYVMADKDSVVLYRTKDWTRQRSYDVDRNGGPIAFLPDGRLAATRAGVIAVFGAGSRAEVGLPCINGAMRMCRVNSVDFSGDGRWALSAEGIEFDKRELAGLVYDTSAAIRVLDVSKGNAAARLTGHADSVWAAAFSPDQKSIVSASADGTIRVWKLPDVMREKPTPAGK